MLLPLLFVISTLAVTESSRSEEGNYKFREIFPIIMSNFQKTLLVFTALLLDLLYGDFEDLGDETNEKCSNLLTACPAFTQQEKEFDKKVSLSGNSLFSRHVYPNEEYVKNIELFICDKPYKPVMIYNIEREKYEIGYEVGTGYFFIKYKIVRISFPIERFFFF